MLAFAKPWRRHSAFRVPHSALGEDAWDRLVKVHADDGQGGQGDLVATYSYDGARRRTRRAVEGAPDVAYDYFYSGYQVVEVRKDQSASPYEQYVWGVRYVHSPVCRWYDADADGQGVVLHYYLNDANFNVTALVESDGDVAERVAYDPYGEPTFYDEDWENPSGESAVANAVLFTGHRLDSESGCYNTLWRYYHPTLGRWVSRDPMKYPGSLNLLQYVRTNPTSLADPRGDVPWKPNPAGRGSKAICQLGPRRGQFVSRQEIGQSGVGTYEGQGLNAWGAVSGAVVQEIFQSIENWIGHSLVNGYQGLITWQQIQLACATRSLPAPDPDIRLYWNQRTRVMYGEFRKIAAVEAPEGVAAAVKGFDFCLYPEAKLVFEAYCGARPPSIQYRILQTVRIFPLEGGPYVELAGKVIQSGWVHQWQVIASCCCGLGL
jgi:RHS repeat-associated protein